MHLNSPALAKSKLFKADQLEQPFTAERRKQEQADSTSAVRLRDREALSEGICLENI